MSLSEKPERPLPSRPDTECTNPLQEEYLRTLSARQPVRNSVRPDLYAMHPGWVERPMHPGSPDWAFHLADKARDALKLNERNPGNGEDLRDAEKNFRESLQLADRHNISGGLVTCASLRTELAQVLLSMNPPRREEAARLLQESLQRQEQMRKSNDRHSREPAGQSSPLAIQTEFQLGVALQGLGRKTEADTHFQAAMRGLHTAQTNQMKLDDLANSDGARGRPRPGLPDGPTHIDGRPIWRSYSATDGGGFRHYTVSGDIDVYSDSTRRMMTDMARHFNASGDTSNASSLTHMQQTIKSRWEHFQRNGEWPSRR